MGAESVFTFSILILNGKNVLHLFLLNMLHPSDLGSQVA